MEMEPRLVGLWWLWILLILLGLWLLLVIIF